MPTFLRSDTRRHLRLGKRKKKLQKWRRPRGRHSKIRRKRFGYPVKVAIGYKHTTTEAGKVNGKRTMLVHNLTELERVPKNSAVILARVGARKKLVLIKRANELKLSLVNVKVSP